MSATRKILSALEAIAPLTAIRGNIDRSGPCAALSATEIVDMGGTTFYLVHDLDELDLDPMAARISVVISGHSHKPLIEDRRGVLYLNPGSAGPRRFSLPITIGLVTLGNGSPQAEIIPLFR